MDPVLNLEKRPVTISINRCHSTFFPQSIYRVGLDCFGRDYANLLNNNNNKLFNVRFKFTIRIPFFRFMFRFFFSFLFFSHGIHKHHKSEFVSLTRQPRVFRLFFWIFSLINILHLVSWRFARPKFKIRICTDPDEQNICLHGKVSSTFRRLSPHPPCRKGNFIHFFSVKIYHIIS